MKRRISSLSRSSCFFTSQLYLSLFSSVMVNWYLILVLFCTMMPFFLQTINGAGAPCAGHQRDEVWLKRTNWVLATLSSLGSTGRKQINEITKWVGVLLIAIYSSVLRPLINILELFQLVISEDNTCKVECFVGVRAPKPAKIIEKIWFSDPQVLSTGSNNNRHVPSTKYTKKIGRLLVSITNLKIHIINGWCCMWSPQAEIQFHIMSLWSLQKFTWAERWNNSLKAYFRY